MDPTVDFFEMSATELAAAIANRRISARDVVAGYLNRIEKYDPEIGAFVYVSAASSLRAAERIDKKIAAGEDAGPFGGVPFAVKDFSDVLQMPTYQGTRALPTDSIAAMDEPMVARLRAAGAIPIGKTNVPEFGMHSATYNERFGVTRNPWNLEKTPGGSSGGSSAAVTAGLVPFATGSDGGGSIRTPAAFCGLIGLKTTTALIPRTSGQSQLSCLGYLTRTVADTARLLDVSAGVHPADRLSAPNPVESFERSMETCDVAGLKIVWSNNLGYAPMDDEVVNLARSAFNALVLKAGLLEARSKVVLPNVYKEWVLDSLNFLSDELRLKGISLELLDKRTQKLLETFSHSDGLSHIRVHQKFSALEAATAKLFDTVDLLATPSTSCPAFGAGDEAPGIVNGKDATWTGAEPLSMFANVAGMPAISIPAGVTRDGLPVGLQVASRRFEDARLLRLARIMEQTRPWPLLAPNYRS